MRTRDALLPGLLSYVLGMSSEIERRWGLAAAHAAAAESVQLAADTSAGTQCAFALVRLGAAQRDQARRLLDQTLATFTKLGAITWAAQAGQLTPREFQICALVAEGAPIPRPRPSCS